MKLIELYKLKLSVRKIKIDVIILEYVNSLTFGAVDESMRSKAIKRVTARVVMKSSLKLCPNLRHTEFKNETKSSSQT